MTPAPFYIGQEVVALVTIGSTLYPNHRIKKGTTYTVIGMQYCCEWRIGIGVTYDEPLPCSCAACDKVLDKSCMFPAKLFAPKEEFPADLEKEIEEALTRQLEPELV